MSGGPEDDRARWDARLARLGLAPDADERAAIARARADREAGLARLHLLDELVDVEHGAIDRGRGT